MKKWAILVKKLHLAEHGFLLPIYLFQKKYLTILTLAEKLIHDAKFLNRLFGHK